MTRDQKSDGMVHIPFYRTEDEKRFFLDQLRGDLAKDVTPRQDREAENMA